MEQDSMLPVPDVKIRNVGATSFTAVWDVVENAGSFTCIFNGEEFTTEKREVSFDGLQANVEYVLAVRSNPGVNAGYTASDYVYIHVITDDEYSLDKPSPRLVAAYRSKTIVTWNSISGASFYEYRVGGISGTVESNEATVSGLEGSTEYDFEVRAVSDRPYVNPSGYGVLTFTTEPDDKDIPEVIVDVLESGPDYLNFNVYVLPDFSYFYAGVPASYFVSHTDQEILETYRGYLMEAAESSGKPLESALGSYLSYGSANYTDYPLYPELSYYVVVFGMDLQGNLTSPLYKFPAHTVANGASDGPDFGGSDWFSQMLYLYTYGAYTYTNSIWCRWKGTDVEAVKYLLTSTYSYKNYFGGDNDALKAYVEEYGADIEADYIMDINSEKGLTNAFTLSAATSYTLATMAYRPVDGSTFCVNSMATKASSYYYDWFFVELGQNQGTPAYNSLAATLQIAFDPAEELNIHLHSLKYYLCTNGEASGHTEAELLALVEEKGIGLTPSQVAVFNVGGSMSLVFGGNEEPLKPSSTYVLLVKAVNDTGDVVLRYDSAATASAPDGASAWTKSGWTGRIAGKPAPHPVGIVGKIVDFKTDYEIMEK